MLIIIGGIVFGLLIGYLAWYAIRPGEQGVKITLKTVSAFVSIVAGGTILTILQLSTEFLSAYCIGLGVGFFFTPVQRFVSKFTNEHKNFEKKQQIEKEKADIDRKWVTIENYVRTKLQNHLIAESGLYVGFMNELDYTTDSKAYILKRFAQEHIDEGFAISDSYKKYGEVGYFNDIEHTHLYKDPFFIHGETKTPKIVK